MRRRTGRARAKAGMGARRGLWGLARIVRLITSVVVGLIVIAIALVLFEANRDNSIVDWLVGAGDDLTQPFHGIFDPDGRKAMVSVNWGLAAVVYALIGGFIARLLRR
jgi:xanthine/uracil permease